MSAILCPHLFHYFDKIAVDLDEIIIEEVGTWTVGCSKCGIRAEIIWDVSAPCGGLIMRAISREKFHPRRVRFYGSQDVNFRDEENL